MVALGIFNFYVCEKMRIAYSYEKPANYKQLLYVWALDLAKFAPVAMFFGGFWAFGELQLFYN